MSINALLVSAFVPAAALCFFWVLVSLPVFISIEPRAERLLRLAPLRIMAFAAGLALGIGAGTMAVQKVVFGIPQDTVRGISGVLLDDPRIISGGRAMTTISLRMVMGSGGVRATAHGEITVFFPEENAARLKEFGRGTEVFADGYLRSNTGNFGSAYTFSAENLHITKTAPPFERFRTNLRLGLVQRFANGKTDGWGGLAIALLVGIRDNLDTELVSLYRDAGCSYILALSGMHLAVLIGLISFLLKKPLGLRPAAITGALIIIAYCFIVGPLPSLIRSALMYILGVLAVLGMLKRDALALLCMAFLIQLLATPQAGLSLSFILSYTALLGILIIGVVLNELLKGFVPPFLLQSLNISLGAFIATAAITTWFFGVLRPVGIVAGLIIAPLTTVFMIGSMAWLALDSMLPVLSPVLGKPLSLLYWLMEKTAQLAAYIPGIKANPMLIVSLSLLLVVLILWLDYRRRLVNNRLEPFA